MHYAKFSIQKSLVFFAIVRHSVKEDNCHQNISGSVKPKIRPTSCPFSIITKVGVPLIGSLMESQSGLGVEKFSRVRGKVT